MLSPAQLKPYLQHEDNFVREAVASYFNESWSQDAELAEMIIANCRKYGYEAERYVMSRVDHIPWTKTAFQHIVDDLGKIQSKTYRAEILDWLRNAPLDFFDTVDLQRFDDCEFVATMLKYIKKRRHVVELSPEQMWKELQDISEEFDGDAIDEDYADILIEQLAQHDIPDKATVRKLIPVEAKKYSWLGTFLIGLIGARGWSEFIPILVERYNDDTDYHLEHCTNALARIGDAQAVHEVRARFEKASLDFRFCAAGALGCIKHPDAEQANLDLLATQSDPTVRAYLCLNLCNLFSERGVEVVSRTIKLATYDKALVDLRKEFLPVLDVLGIEAPNMQRWRRLRAKSRKRLDAEMADLDDWVDSADEWGEEEFAWDEEVDWKPSKQAVSSRRTKAKPHVPAPAVRSQERVGRNDPCPCGSGKKFKKCCLKAGRI